MGIYKECDIRGVYEEELDEAVAYEIGRAVGTIMKGRKMVVAGDVRLSTPSLKDYLTRGILESGTNIIDIGFVPTPAFYFAKNHLGADGGITVTASHNPARFNGFKLILGELPVTPRDIKMIGELAGTRKFAEGTGYLQKADIVYEYVDFLMRHVKMFKRLKIVIDAGNGSTSVIAPVVFRKMGYEVVELFCEYNGAFPNREPNPAVYENLEKLQGKVIAEAADLGVGFDGDGDRVVFVDEKGSVSKSEESFVLFIREYLKGKPSSVVYDIKSSSIVEREILKYGSRPLMERSGHSFIKSTFLKNGSALAGEISGHFFFKELGCDDGIFAALKMAEILGRNNVTLSSCRQQMEKTLITPDIRIPYPIRQQERLLSRLKRLKQEYLVEELDGVRIVFQKGWLLVRKSVTEPCITIRMEAENVTELDNIRNILLNHAPELDSYLSVNFL